MMQKKKDAVVVRSSNGASNRNSRHSILSTIIPQRTIIFYNKTYYSTTMTLHFLLFLLLLLLGVNPSHEFAASTTRIDSSSSLSSSSSSSSHYSKHTDQTQITQTQTPLSSSSLPKAKRNRRGIQKSWLLEQQIRTLLSSEENNSSTTQLPSQLLPSQQLRVPTTLRTNGQRTTRKERRRQQSYSSHPSSTKRARKVVVAVSSSPPPSLYSTISKQDIASVHLLDSSNTTSSSSNDDTEVAATRTDNDNNNNIVVILQLVNGTNITITNTQNLHQKYELDVWLSIRSSLDVTASEFSSIINTSYFTSRNELLQRKLGIKPEFNGNAACKWGLNVEPIAFRQYQQVTQNHVKESGLHIKMIPINTDNNDDGQRRRRRRRRRQLCLGASPDGLVTDHRLEAKQQQHGLLEIKCLYGQRTKKSLKQYEYCPKRFYDQIQGQLAICDLPWCDLMIWIPQHGNGAGSSSKKKKKQQQKGGGGSGKNYSILRVERNVTYWETILRPAIQEFCYDLDNEKMKIEEGTGTK